MDESRNDVIEDIKRKINNLEYKEIKDIREDITNIKLDLQKNTTMTEQAIKVSDKLTETMSSVEKAMIKMADSMELNNKNTRQLSDNMITLNKQINELDNKVDKKFNEVDSMVNTIDDKGKFDIILWIKSNFITVILVIGAIAYIINQMLNR